MPARPVLPAAKADGTSTPGGFSKPKRKLKEATGDDDWDALPEACRYHGSLAGSRQHEQFVDSDEAYAATRRVPNTGLEKHTAPGKLEAGILQPTTKASAHGPDDRRDVIIISETDGDSGQDVTKAQSNEQAKQQASSHQGKAHQSPPPAQEDQRAKNATKEPPKEDHEKGSAGASASKRAKAAAATPGCCWKCGATKSQDWQAFYVDGAAQQICKGCQVYHKDNKIVVDALLPEEPDIQDPGESDFGHPSNLRTRAQQRLPETQAHANPADVTMDGSQIYASSAQGSITSGLIAGRCKRCGVLQSTSWYDDDKQRPLCVCAACHHKRWRISAASPHKRSRAEGEGVTFDVDADVDDGAHGGRAARRNNKSPKAGRTYDKQVDATTSGDDGVSQSNESDSEATHEAMHMMMSQAFGDDSHQQIANCDEYGPSDQEAEDEDEKRGVFAGHAFLVTGVEMEEKRRIRQQIESEGGEIVDCNSVEPGREPPNLLILTSAPCKTSNFLCGLAVGVRVVSTQWVADCLASKQLCPTDSYRLDAAFDPDTRARTKVPRHFCSRPLAMEKRVLAGKRVTIIGNKPFQHDHVRMLRFAGAVVSSVESSLEPGEGLDYIICEASIKFRPTSRQISAAHARNIPMVNSEWLCACVRQHKLVSTDAYRVAHLANAARIRLFYPAGSTGAACSAAESDLKMVITGMCEC